MLLQLSGGFSNLYPGQTFMLVPQTSKTHCAAAADEAAYDAPPEDTSVSTLAQQMSQLIRQVQPAGEEERTAMAALAQGIAEQDDMAVRSLAELIAEQERAAAASLAQGIAEHVCGPRARGDPAMEETLGVVSCWGELDL